MFGKLSAFLFIFLTTASIAVAQNESGNLLPFATFDQASEAVLNDPHDLVIGPDNRIYVADKFANRIAVMDKETLKLLDSFGESELASPHDVDFDAQGRAIVADTGNDRVAIFEFRDGKAQLVESLSDGIFRPEGAVAHPNGRIYATGSGTGNIVAYENGKLVAQATGLSSAHDVEVDGEGNLWVADTFNQRIVKFSPDLQELQTLEGPVYGWLGPRYLDIDKAGRLVVADQDAHRILLIEKDGALVGVLGDGLPGAGPNKFDDPEGVDIWGPAYYFADSDNNRIVRYLLVTN